MVYVAVCIPADMLTELTLTSYPGNFIENGTEGPIKIMVEGANGSKAIEYKMWIAELQCLTIRIHSLLKQSEYGRPS